MQISFTVCLEDGLLVLPRHPLDGDGSRLADDDGAAGGPGPAAFSLGAAVVAVLAVLRAEGVAAVNRRTAGSRAGCSRVSRMRAQTRERLGSSPRHR